MNDSFKDFQKQVSKIRGAIESWGLTLDWMEQVLGEIPVPVLRIPDSMMSRYSTETPLSEPEQATYSDLKFSLQLALYTASLEGWTQERLSDTILQIVNQEEFRWIVGNG